MSSKKPDILELYGLPPANPAVALRLEDKLCPFVGGRCVKYLRGSGTPTGVCSVSAGATSTPVIVCPNRLYGDNYATLQAAALEAFGAARFIAGGSKAELGQRLREQSAASVVAFGQRSGGEVQITGTAKMSFDWILQHYDSDGDRTGFVAVEVQSMDTTGNYREALDGYRELHAGKRNVVHPPSSHGINWANVHKRLLPQLIRKGSVLSTTPGCQGFFFVVPNVVFKRFEAVLADLPDQYTLGADIISVRTYDPDTTTSSGVRMVRSMNYKITDVANAYYARPDDRMSDKLDKTLQGLLK